MQTYPSFNYQGRFLEAQTLPSLPSVLNEATALLESGKASVAKIADILSRDQVLSATILRMVNAPAYGFPGRISTVQNAVALLGFTMVQTLIISQLATQTLSTTMHPLWEHSYACSLACGRIAKILHLDNAGESVAAGLLHDFGKAIAILNFPDAYEEVDKLVTAEDLTFIEAEKEVLGFSHLDVNAWIATQWKLPESLKCAMVYHHDPEQAGEYATLAGVVHLADFFVRLFEYGSGGDTQISRLTPTATRQLKVQKNEFADMLDDIGAVLHSSKMSD